MFVLMYRQTFNIYKRSVFETKRWNVHWIKTSPIREVWGNAETRIWRTYCHDRFKNTKVWQLSLIQVTHLKKLLTYCIPIVKTCDFNNCIFFSSKLISVRDREVSIRLRNMNWQDWKCTFIAIVELHPLQSK